MSDPGLYVYQPGLLGPVTAQARHLLADHDDLRPLLHLLRYGDRLAGPSVRAGVEARLCTLWGVSREESGDGPVGAVSALGDALEVPAGHTIFRAAPVQLIADRDRLLLYGIDQAQIDDAGNAACIAALNQGFADQPLSFHAGASGCWYVSTSLTPDLRTTPLDQAVGRSMADSLPTGNDARRWIAWLNEMQMLLFALPLNRDREQQGLPCINGLWLWGGGEAPSGIGNHWPVAGGISPLQRGFARLSGARWVDIRQPGWQASFADSGLVELPALPEVTDGPSFEQWEQAVRAASRDWIRPLLDRVRLGRLAELRLDAGQAGVWRYRRGHRRRSWRRPVRLQQAIAVTES